MVGRIGYPHAELGRDDGVSSVSIAGSLSPRAVRSGPPLYGAKDSTARQRARRLGVRGFGLLDGPSALPSARLVGARNKEIAERARAPVEDVVGPLVRQD